MNIVWWIVAVILVELLLLLGAAVFFVCTVERKFGKPIGDLWVDPSETMPGEGMYVIFNGGDPKAFMDGQNVMLRVRVRKENK